MIKKLIGEYVGLGLRFLHATSTQEPIAQSMNKTKIVKIIASIAFFVFI
jgi:hypothetical protein